MTEDENIELIDRYLNGETNEAQATEVELRLKNDPEFLRLHDQLKISLAAVRSHARENLRQEIKDLEHTLIKRENRTIVLKKYWPIGVAAVLVVALGIFWLKPNTKPAPSLFAQVFVPYPNVVMPTVRGEDSGPSGDHLKSAYEAYDRGDYESALSIFASTPKKDAAILLYLGNCYLAIGDPAKARKQFETLQADFDVFDDQAEWFTALSFLSENNLNECIERLNTIVDKRNDYSSKASDLLLKLNSTSI